MENRTADALIRKIGMGDMTALEELYNALSKAVFAFALSIVKNRSVAEDIMQDTFVRIYNSASAFKVGGSGVSWVMRIAHNLAINAVKSRHYTVDELEDDMSVVTNTDSAITDRITLNQALSRLGDTERKIVILHASVGLTLSEIAEILGEPVGTVKWRHSGALKKLRKMLEETEVTE